MLADYHVHTEFSNDSIYPMEEVVKDAISLGIKDICFTDHVDYGPYRDWDDPRGIKYRPGDEGEPEQVALTNVDCGKYFSMIEIAFFTFSSSHPQINVVFPARRKPPVVANLVT